MSNEKTTLPEAVTRSDMYLKAVAEGNQVSVQLPDPVTRTEIYLKAFLDDSEHKGGGLPAGGTSGQVLTKNSDVDGDAAWKDAPAGGATGDFLPLAGGTMKDGAVIGGYDITLKPTLLYLDAGSNVYLGHSGAASQVTAKGKLILNQGGFTNVAPAADGFLTNKKYVDGVAIPVGGTAGQILAKKSATDRDCQWIDAPSGGGSSTPKPMEFKTSGPFDGQTAIVPGFTYQLQKRFGSAAGLFRITLAHDEGKFVAFPVTLHGDGSIVNCDVFGVPDSDNAELSKIASLLVDETGELVVTNASGQSWDGFVSNMPLSVCVEKIDSDVIYP